MNKIPVIFMRTHTKLLLTVKHGIQFRDYVQGKSAAENQVLKTNMQDLYIVRIVVKSAIL